MGSPAVRITREELVAPPDFAGHGLTKHEAARIGGARIELVRSGGETRLGTCYQQIPVRLLPPFNFEREPAALLYLINLTAGLMDGDGHLLQLAARRGVKAVVTGQSATRVHPALTSYATQQWEVNVEDDACLVVLPGPLIPFRGCRYYQRARVELAPTARLIWGDIWLPGRYERGDLSERFVFERIVQDLEVRRAGRLAYRDRYSWDGPWNSEEAAWYFGGELCAAGLFVSGPIPALDLAAKEHFRRAVFPLDSGDTCLRWCGSPAAVTADVVQTALRIAGNWTGGENAPPWLLDSNNLAPNHWFSTLADGSRPLGVPAGVEPGSTPADPR